MIRTCLSPEYSGESSQEEIIDKGMERSIIRSVDVNRLVWIPACAGTTESENRERQGRKNWERQGVKVGKIGNNIKFLLICTTILYG